jgi:hypothetical protein
LLNASASGVNWFRGACWFSKISAGTEIRRRKKPAVELRHQVSRLEIDTGRVADSGQFHGSNH